RRIRNIFTPLRGYTSSVSPDGLPPSPQGEGIAPAALATPNYNLTAIIHHYTTLMIRFPLFCKIFNFFLFPKKKCSIIY
ncbi:MAG: hypothetical protein UHS47_07360, partial [Oscillospiraceae bacterium]|nr:hypothetical protein [Oscillospiraceae bacterium]